MTTYKKKRIHPFLALQIKVAVLMEGLLPGEGWVLTTGIWNNSEYWDNTAFYKNNP